MPHRADPAALSATRTTRSAVGWALPAGFLLLAGLLMSLPKLVRIPLSPAAEVDRAQLVVGPRREAMGDPARLLVEGRPQTCNGCHQIFNSSHAGGAALNYHEDIRLTHGINNRCTNCHDATNRELLTLRDGATVAFSQTPELCSQCHGTVYRDWPRGTHGKTLGSWVTGSPAQRRLNCNECHNPHAPKYEPLKPLPGPTTLRMGVPKPHEGHEGKQSPLRRWLPVRPPAESSADAHGGEP